MSGVSVSVAASAVVLLLVSAASAETTTFNQTFDSGFTAIDSSVPCNGVITNSTDDKTYSVELTGPTELVKAFQPRLSGNVLDIDLKPNAKLVVALNDSTFYTVRMPQGKLQALSTTGSGDVGLAGDSIDSQIPAFNLSNSGPGIVSLRRFPAIKAEIDLDGTGKVVVMGSQVPSAALSIAGIGSVYVGNVTGPVTVEITGMGSANIMTGGSTNASISGSVTGVGKVNYDGGKCSVKGLSESACDQRQITMPF